MEQRELKKYPPVVIFEENDGKEYYRASFKEFPDMIGGIGDTVQEAIEAAYEMLDVEIDFREEMGLEVPQPIMTKLCDEPSGRVTFRMGKSVHRRAIEAAEEEGISLNAFINDAVQEKLGAKKASVMLSPAPIHRGVWETYSAMALYAKQASAGFSTTDQSIMGKTPQPWEAIPNVIMAYRRESND